MSIAPVRLGKGDMAALTAFALLMLQIRLSNAVLYPLFDGVLPVARDMGAGALFAASLATVAVALYKPNRLKGALLSVLAAILATLGAGLLAVGLCFGNVVALGAGAILANLSASWVSIVVYVACTRLESRNLLIGLPGAYAVSYGISWLFFQTGPVLPMTAILISPLISLTLAFSIARQRLADANTAMPQADAQITHPSSFLPLTSRLYVCMFLVTATLGFNLRFGTEEGSLAAVLPCVAMLLFISLNGVLDGRRERYDWLFRVSLLLITGGFLLAPLSDYRIWAQTLMSAADAGASILFPIVLISVAARNPAASITVFAWNSCLTTMGSIVGANLGAYVGGNAQIEEAFLISAVLALALLGYVLFGLHDFSFAKTIEGIEPYVPPEVPANSTSAAASFDETCAAIAAAHGLTPRELDVMRLLAKGRNNAVIQDELVLSRNTVKTYIKHIYTKLNVHSQQEVIDLVDHSPKI